MRGKERADDATHCVACGQPLRITGASPLRFHTVRETHLGWHAEEPCESAGWNATRKLTGEETQANKGKAN